MSIKFVAVFRDGEPIYISKAVSEIEARNLQHLFGEGDVIDIAHRQRYQDQIIEANVREFLGAA